MGNISFNSYKDSVTSSEHKKRTDSEENFTALDKEKLKQDTVQLSQNAQQGVQDNWAVKTATNITGNNTKKFAISLLATLGTVIGLAALGNSKLSVHKMTELGIDISEKIKSNKVCKTVNGFLGNAKQSISKTLNKNKTINDITNTLKVNRAKPKLDMTRGYGQGFVSIFSLTPVDILKTTLSKMDEGKQLSSLTKILGDENTAKSFQKLLNTSKDEAGRQFTNREICKEFTDLISKNFGCKNKKDLYNILSQMEKGKITGTKGDLNIDISEFTNVLMNGEQSKKSTFDLIGKWWPVNIVDKIGSKIKGDKWKPFGRGNLGNSLIKYNVVAGNLADTKIGSLIQKSILVPTESISNFVNDKSGMGVMLCATIMSLYNNVQDAPKEQKFATIADDFIGTIGSIAISTPLAFATTYGLASLGNLEGKTLLSKPLKLIGKFFGMGLDPIKNGVAQPKQAKNAFGAVTQKLKGVGGGALRFALVMFVFSSMFSKPIRNIIHKIFGKPYDKNEEEQKKQLEEQRKQVIPELGITQGELEEKIQKNPAALERLQKEPELAKKLNENPKLLLDLLDGKDINNTNATKTTANSNSAKPAISPANENLIKNKTNIQKQQQNTSLNNNQNKPQAMPLQNNQTNQNNLFDKKTPAAENKSESEQEETTRIKDNATYIPSSASTVTSGSLDEVQSQEINDALEKADKILAKAEKYI